MGELRYRIKKAFDAEGIEIPWPHTKVYFGNALPNSKSGEQ
jgi:small conductance mechanosensitive channel